MIHIYFSFQVKTDELWHQAINSHRLRKRAETLDSVKGYMHGHGLGYFIQISILYLNKIDLHVCIASSHVKEYVDCRI